MRTSFKRILGIQNSVLYRGAGDVKCQTTWLEQEARAIAILKKVLKWLLLIAAAGIVAW
jgi:hypothetical protein